MEEKPYLVTVIMSTYNGHEYIEQQLESLLIQQGVRINLFVRDDGSKDNTIELIKLYSNKFNSLTIISEANIGATASFHRAAKLSLNSEITEYYAFCDQDDIWLEDKLITGIRKISHLDNKYPNLYFSNLMMMNNDGDLLGTLLDNSLVSCSSYNALAAIYAYGCTCVFNRSALEKFCCLPEANRYIYHDNWMYSICCFMGTVFYDQNSYMRYRQTGSNVSGEKKTGLSIWIQRLSKLFNLSEDKRIYESIAQNLVDSFQNQLNREDYIFLKRICNYRSSCKDKVYLLITKRMKTNRYTKNACIIGRILLNRL